NGRRRARCDHADPATTARRRVPRASAAAPRWRTTPPAPRRRPPGSRARRARPRRSTPDRSWRPRSPSPTTRAAGSYAPPAWAVRPPPPAGHRTRGPPDPRRLGARPAARRRLAAQQHGALRREHAAVAVREHHVAALVTHLAHRL